MGSLVRKWGGCEDSLDHGLDMSGLTRNTAGRCLPVVKRVCLVRRRPSPPVVALWDCGMVRAVASTVAAESSVGQACSGC